MKESDQLIVDLHKLRTTESPTRHEIERKP